jgi:uncharacterized protein (TIGR02453 family)
MSITTGDSRRFFSQLGRNNSRDWMQAHKPEYEAHVALPFATLLAALPRRHHPFKTFRLVRDTRFSKDKSPYKLMLGAAHKRARESVEYVHVDCEGVLAAVGHYVMTPERLARFRSALLQERSGASFARTVGALKDRSIEVEPGGAAPLRTAPRGVDSAHPRIQWLKWKGCIAMRKWPVSAQQADPAAVAAFFVAARPLLQWMDQHV